MRKSVGDLGNQDVFSFYIHLSVILLKKQKTKTKQKQETNKENNHRKGKQKACYTFPKLICAIIHVFQYSITPTRTADAPVSVAQWIARRTSNPEAVGSSPTGDVTVFF